MKLFHSCAAIAAVLISSGCEIELDDDDDDQPPPLGELADELRPFVEPVTVETADDVVVDLVGEDRVVLLGESTHGTDELYRARAEISVRLLAERGFDAVTLEADWPAVERVDAYVRGLGEDASAEAALAGFERFPQWMWRNEAFVAFVEELRALNADRPEDEQVRLFGMDLFSAVESGEAVVAFLEAHDAAGAAAARDAYECLPRAVEYGFDPGDTSCAHGLAAPLAATRRFAREEGGFSAVRNAQLVVDAEAYYRLANRSPVASWNHRDRYMLDTLIAIETELDGERDDIGQLVWAHNSHVGDARATERGDFGELNLGQLAREHWGGQVTTIGLTTSRGTVLAAPAWGAEPRVFDLQPARTDSIEGVFHEIGEDAFALETGRREVQAIIPWLLERAIGVVYRPRTELESHYFLADISQQFDAVIHFDVTHAVTPLEALPAPE